MIEEASERPLVEIDRVHALERTLGAVLDYAERGWEVPTGVLEEARAILGSPAHLDDGAVRERFGRH